MWLAESGVRRQSSELSQSVSSSSRFYILLVQTLSGEPRCGLENEQRYAISPLLCTSVTLCTYLWESARIRRRHSAGLLFAPMFYLAIEACLRAARRDYQMSVTDSWKRITVLCFCPRDVLLLWVINIAHKLVNTNDMKKARSPVTVLPLYRSSAVSFVGTGRPDGGAVTLMSVVRSHGVAAAQDLWTGIYFLPSLQLVALAQ